MKERNVQDMCDCVQRTSRGGQCIVSKRLRSIGAFKRSSSRAKSFLNVSKIMPHSMDRSAGL